MNNYFDASVLKNAKAYVYTRDNSEDKVDYVFVRNLRKQYQMSQAVFASVIGVSKKTVEKWEQQKNPISNSTKKLLYLIDLHPEIISDLYSVDILNSSKEFKFDDEHVKEYKSEVVLNPDYTEYLRNSKSENNCLGCLG